jgi:predicted metal-dependent hydrolase
MMTTSTSIGLNNFHDLNIEYRLSRRRRSIGLMVTVTGKLVVSAPPGTTRADLDRALTRHQAWIDAKVAERREAWGRLTPGTAFFLGQTYRLSKAPGPGAAVELAAGELTVRPPGGAPDLWPTLEAWYRRQAANFLGERVRHFGIELRLAVRELELKAWKRRWGECHPDGRLRFNWRLILLPPPIIDYVVAHELAHLLVPGHNPRFWGVVGRAVPDYAERRRWLNRYGSPFLLWRAEF